MAAEFKLSVIRLTGDNFPDLSFSLKMAASAYGFWDQFCPAQASAADSSSASSSSSSSGKLAKKAEKAESEPASSSSSFALQQVVSVETAKAWVLLMQSTDSKFHVRIRACATPADAFRFLRDQHSATSTLNINNVLSDFFEVSLDDVKDVEDLIKKLQGLREQDDTLVEPGQRLSDSVYTNQLLRAVACDARFAPTVATIKETPICLSRPFTPVYLQLKPISNAQTSQNWPP